jgi:hypothetical protein
MKVSSGYFEDVYPLTGKSSSVGTLFYGYTSPYGEKNFDDLNWLLFLLSRRELISIEIILFTPDIPRSG